jgi:hypothetical protein
MLCQQQDSKKRYADLLSGWTVALVNAALCDFHACNCPASGQLTKACDAVSITPAATHHSISVMPHASLASTPYQRLSDGLGTDGKHMLGACGVWLAASCKPKHCFLCAVAVLLQAFQLYSAYETALKDYEWDLDCSNQHVSTNGASRYQ